MTLSRSQTHSPWGWSTVLPSAAMYVSGALVPRVRCWEGAELRLHPWCRCGQIPTLLCQRLRDREGIWKTCAPFLVELVYSKCYVLLSFLSPRAAGHREGVTCVFLRGRIAAHSFPLLPSCGLPCRVEGRSGSRGQCQCSGVVACHLGLRDSASLKS